MAPDAIDVANQAMWGEEMLVLVDSLASDDFPEEPVSEEEPKINFNGFRQAFFEASEEANHREVSSLRLGIHNLESEVAPSMESLLAKFEEARDRLMLDRSACLEEISSDDSQLLLIGIRTSVVRKRCKRATQVPPIQPYTHMQQAVHEPPSALESPNHKKHREANSK